MSRQQTLIMVILGFIIAVIGGYLYVGEREAAPVATTATVQEEVPSAMPQADDLPDEVQSEPARPLMGRVDEVISTDNETSRLPVASETPVMGKKWMLNRLGAKELPAEGRTPFLTLEEADSRVTGMAGCNRFSGSFTLSEEALRFSEDFMMTRMACDAMETEGAFITALKQVESWRVEGDRLILMDKDKNEVARFIDVASTAP